MQPNQPKKETTFNSSIATLMRIDKLIKELHSLRRGIMPLNDFGMPLRTGNPNELYLDTLFDVHVEVATKMGIDEFTDSEKHQEGIDTKKESYGRNLYMKTISKGMPPHEYSNEKYYEGWNELHKLGDKYFLFLLKTADNHGMLLTTKESGEDATTKE